MVFPKLEAIVDAERPIYRDIIDLEYIIISMHSKYETNKTKRKYNYRLSG